MGKMRTYVHVKSNGIQVFYKGEYLDTEDSYIKILKADDTATAYIHLAQGESVGEYFDTTVKQE